MRGDFVRKYTSYLLFMFCVFMQGCFYQRNFQDGFGLIFYAKAYDLKENKCYELDATQFNDLINSISKQAEKIESPEIKRQIKEDFKLEKHLVIRLRYPASMDDLPDQIEVTSDGYLRDFSGYYRLSKEHYTQLIEFVKSSQQCD